MSLRVKCYTSEGLLQAIGSFFSSRGTSFMELSILEAAIEAAVEAAIEAAVEAAV